MRYSSGANNPHSIVQKKARTFQVHLPECETPDLLIFMHEKKKKLKMNQNGITYMTNLRYFLIKAMAFLIPLLGTSLDIDNHKKTILFTF